jgi:hypothetical protein
MNKLLITKDLNNKIKFGPSASIINELKYNKKNYKKICIIDHGPSEEVMWNDKKIKNIVIKNLVDLIKKFNLILNVVKNSDEIEIHCIFDVLLFFPLIILLYIYKKEFKIYLRGMVNDNVLVKKKILKKIYLYLARFFIKKATIIYTSNYEKENSTEEDFISFEQHGIFDNDNEVISEDDSDVAEQAPEIPMDVSASIIVSADTSTDTSDARDIAQIFWRLSRTASSSAENEVNNENVPVYYLGFDSIG